MLRRTKIVATLGPSTDDPQVMDAIIQGGVDVVRLNFSHGTGDDHLRRAHFARERARGLGREICILADLQGPKIRIERFQDNKITLKEGDPFVLDATCPADGGTQTCVGITYKQLPNDVNRGDTLLLDDGRLVLWVDSVAGQAIECRVVIGGELSNSKGINRQGGGLSANALTQKDREDMKVVVEMGADYTALSFPRSAQDVHEARELLRAMGGRSGIVSKIERAEALEAIDEIIAASDAVMIARGDLGVEIGDAELPAVQKDIIQRARNMNRAVITATQMMESMIENQVPTRAEVFDVANAVLDGTDAVMLSAETATGNYPAKVVSAMDRICRSAEKQRITRVSKHRIDSHFSRIDEAIAMSSMYAANHLGVRAIAALTESGATPLWMSRISSGIPIYALTKHVETCRKATLYRGVYPLMFEIDTTDHRHANKMAIDVLLRQGAVREGDLVIITKGDLMGVHGGTNTMKIVHVGDMLQPDP
ncbi:MAG TPA: pyruvate kinase [Gammaproteobacteria bacterium]|nr:pyruvate kinase [Gammaproteobacteria bacterium]